MTPSDQDQPSPCVRNVQKSKFLCFYEKYCLDPEDVLLTFDPKSVPRFGLPDPDYPRFDQVPTISGQLLVVTPIDVLLTPMQNTHTQTNFFFSYDPPYSRGNKGLKKHVSLWYFPKV